MPLKQRKPPIHSNHHEALGCITAATAVLGDKWTPMIVGELAKAGRLGFCSLQDKAGGVNPRTLSARLDELATKGIISKKILATAPPKVEYTLTPKGRALVPALRAMAAWSKKYT